MSVANIAKAILKAQKEMGNAVKDSKNPFFKSKYADLNSVREASIPVLNNAGVSVLQPTVMVDGRSFVRTTLLHESGESITSDTEIVCAKQNDPQALGSAISYARRYGLQSLLCIGAVDDDGELSMGRSSSISNSATTTTTTSASSSTTAAASSSSTSKAAVTASKPVATAMPASSSNNGGASPIKPVSPFKMKPKATSTTTKAASDDI